ncbi:MAG: calcium-translocating P-type ATPase, PMCA-type [Clostridia bacterium]|nr:calcium-translocating P-type ATPase, PMCA-type [Clostridia bacterium]
MSVNLKGLSDKEVASAREKYGTNALMRVRGKGIVRRFFENLSDPIIRILIAALIIEVAFTFGNCNLIEVFGILVAILIATTVSTLSEYGSEKAFAKIEAECALSRVTAIRNGKDVEIDVDDVVVGDLIRLSRGDKIQADGSIVKGDILVDQSALNGENIEVRKLVCRSDSLSLSDANSVFRGSLVVDGDGIMVVEKIGSDSYYGRLAEDLQTETRESPLKLRLSKLAKQISIIGYIVAALVAFTYLFNVFVVDQGFVGWRIAAALSDTKNLIIHLLRALTLMITVIVVAVPEGLPMMITVVLSANMKRMVKDKVLVKKLVGIETAGSLNILFTDKTGTLTTGKLSVDRIVTECEVYRKLKDLKAYSPAFNGLLLSAKLNTECTVSDNVISGGNSTDRAIYEFFLPERCAMPRVVDRTPFKSEIKYSSVSLDDGRIIIKGAPESIINRCQFALGDGGKVYSSDLKGVKKEYLSAVSKGERVIAVAIGNTDNSDRLIFLGLIILKDKLRSGVREAVGRVMKAGVQVVMLTGDNKDTAISIAEECGFYRSGSDDLAITSDELSTMSDDELIQALPRLRVLARALPQDKSRLVKISAKCNLVVGMTGDGINDAPSLKLADVGFAMGSGSEISKSAGDIVILDDSFEAISKTVLYGRTIFKSIRKFITFQLIMNLAACGITLIGPYFGIDTPITIIQMLWVNIIMDTLGGLAFAGERPLNYYMLEKPKRRDEPILSGNMISHVALNGLYTLFLLVIFIVSPVFKSLYGSLERHLSAFYALFIFAGIANSFTARSDRAFIFFGILKNKAFLIIMSFITAIQMLIIYFGGSLFRSIPLTLRELICVVSLALSVLLFDGIRRVFLKLK